MLQIIGKYSKKFQVLSFSRKLNHKNKKVLVYNLKNFLKSFDLIIFLEHRCSSTQSVLNTIIQSIHLPLQSHNSTSVLAQSSTLTHIHTHHAHPITQHQRSPQPNAFLKCHSVKKSQPPTSLTYKLFLTCLTAQNAQPPTTPTHTHSSTHHHPNAHYSKAIQSQIQPSYLQLLQPLPYLTYTIHPPQPLISVTQTPITSHMHSTTPSQTSNIHHCYHHITPAHSPSHSYKPLTLTPCLHTHTSTYQTISQQPTSCSSAPFLPWVPPFPFFLHLHLRSPSGSSLQSYHPLPDLFPLPSLSN